MELTILLSKVFGIYFIVMGFILLFRRGFFRSIVNLFVEEPALRFVMGIIMLFAGLFMVLTQQDWSTFATGVISFLGWALIVKALLYMNLSNSGVRKWVSGFKVHGAYGLVAGLLALLLGLYLTNFAMGWY
ncbi:hypothetical protein KW807_00370 [Candidatus Parcubacteria bacterium]|nr:hypothetical protein [Candidatus Parcubacteria bacterium]